MPRLLAFSLAVALLIRGFILPAFFAQWCSASSTHYTYGSPPYFRLELAPPEVVGERVVRDFRGAQLLIAVFYQYLLFALASGFLAGFLWPRRRPPTPNPALQRTDSGGVVRP